MRWRTSWSVVEREQSVGLLFVAICGEFVLHGSDKVTNIASVSLWLNALGDRFITDSE